MDKVFKLYNKTGDLISVKKYIPTGWYVLVNHYGHDIKIESEVTNG